MNLPGFTAEASLHKVITSYQQTAVWFNIASQQTISAQNFRKVTIHGTYSASEIKTTCDKLVDGNFYLHPDGNYGCINWNNGCTVHCDALGHCVGWVPA
jgi:hypothetical protein